MLRRCAGLLAEIFEEQAELMHRILRAATEEGTVPAERSDPRTARAIIAQIEGQILLAKLAGDPAVLNDLRPQVRQLVHAPI